MKKQSKKRSAWTKKKIVIAGVLAIAFVVASYFGVWKLYYYNDAAKRVGLLETRELILLAAEGLRKDAPVDPRTGDIYFPESKLYLPNPGTPLTLTYLFDEGNIADAQSELSISTYPLRGTTALYNAQNIDELVAGVPKMQACTRGIKIVHQKFPASDTQNELKHSVQLNNGQTVYVYLEKTCSELDYIAGLLKNIQAY